MEDKPGIDFTDTSFNNTIVDIKRRDMYPSEIARNVLRYTLEPYKELEALGYLKGLGIVLYGGTVSKPSRPKDYDLLVLYDQILPFDPSKSVSDKAQQILASVFSRKDEIANKNTAFRQDFRGDQPIPRYVEINLRSRADFLKGGNETDKQKVSRALQKLIWLPDNIIELYAPHDEILNSEPYIDWGAVDDAATMWLSIADILEYEVSSDEVNALYFTSPKLREFIRDSGGLDQGDEVVKLLQQNLPKLASNKQKVLLKKASGAKEKSRREIIGQMLKQYTQQHKLSPAQKDRIMWLYESFTRGVSIEDTQVMSGVLLYGKNTIQNGQDIFKEDLNYLNF